MKVTVLNAQRASGISKSNSEYDICTVTFCVPVNPTRSERRTVQGFGYNAQEIALDPAALPQFSKLNYPCEVDLVIEPDPRNINRNMCRGIVQ